MWTNSSGFTCRSELAAEPSEVVCELFAWLLPFSAQVDRGKEGHGEDEHEADFNPRLVVHTGHAARETVTRKR
jgi:hypothetical protein